MAEDTENTTEEQEPAPGPASPGPRQWFVMGGALFLLFTISQALAPHLRDGIGKLLAPDPGMATEAEGAEGGEEALRPSDDPPIYQPLNPALVVNFEHDSVVRFLQVTIEVMSRDQAVIDAVEAHSPLIRNNLLLLFSSQDYVFITTREGKEKLRADTLEEIQAIMRAQGVRGVEDVYFTSFVVQ